MGNRHTVTDRRRTDPFPFLENAENFLSVQVIVLGGQPSRKLDQRCVLFAAGEIGDDAVNANKIDNLHALFLMRLSWVCSSGSRSDARSWPLVWHKVGAVMAKPNRNWLSVIARGSPFDYLRTKW